MNFQKRLAIAFSITLAIFYSIERPNAEMNLGHTSKSLDPEDLMLSYGPSSESRYGKNCQIMPQAEFYDDLVTNVNDFFSWTKRISFCSLSLDSGS